jgi:hypothetical protein
MLIQMSNASYVNVNEYTLEGQATC